MDHETPTDAPFVREDVRALLEYLTQVDGPALHELSPVEARAQYRRMRTLADRPRPALHEVRDLSAPGAADERPARLYRPTDATSGTLVLFFHGGGFVIGDLDTHDGFCGELANATGRAVLALDYRLAPEAPFPAAPEDCEAVARWAAGSPDALGLTVTGLATCGDSAGGALAIATARALTERPAALPVLAQCPIYPVVDPGSASGSMREFAEGYLLTGESMRWFDGHYRPDPADPRAGLLAGDHRATPPTAILTAGLDPLRDQGRAYARALVEAGRTVCFAEAAGNIHGLITLRQAIASSQADVSALLATFRALIEEGERGAAC